MSRAKPIRVHLIAGGYPPGSFAGHDMDYVRLRAARHAAGEHATADDHGNDYSDIAKWLPGSNFLITYVAGPYPNDEQNDFIRNWLEAGGRWLALHGTSGGKAVPVGENRYIRKMVKGNYHATLGAFFLNHPPVRKFRVEVADRRESANCGTAGVIRGDGRTLSHRGAGPRAMPNPADDRVGEGSIADKDSASFTIAILRCCPTAKPACSDIRAKSAREA